MSFITFLKQGINLENNLYLRSNSIYPKDEVKNEQASHQYQGIITGDETSITFNVEPAQKISIRTIDYAFQFISVDHTTRKQRLEFWNKRSVQCAQLSWGGTALTALGGGGIAAAQTLLVGTAAIAATWVAGAVAVMGIAILAFGLYRKSEADTQFTTWKDPISSYQILRQNAHKYGFNFVYDRLLKGTVIHPDECLSLWKIHGQVMMQKFQVVNPQNTQLIRQFFEKNPLDLSRLTYAFGSSTNIPEVIQQQSRVYHQMALNYSNICTHADHDRNSINQDKARLIEQNENSRKAWLAPAEKVRNILIDQAEQTLNATKEPLKSQYNKAISEIESQFSAKSSQEDLTEKNKQLQNAKEIYDKNPVLVQAQTQYEKSRANYRALFNLAVLPINTHFDAHKQQIESWAKEQIRQVNQQESNLLAYFAVDIQGLAQAFVSQQHYYQQQQSYLHQMQYPQFVPYVNLQQAYQPTSSSIPGASNFFAQIYQQPMPSAPPL